MSSYGSYMADLVWTRELLIYTQCIPYATEGLIHQNPLKRVRVYEGIMKLLLEASRPLQTLNPCLAPGRTTITTAGTWEPRIWFGVSG